ncbi:TRAFs-binding domain-containing protein [Microvirga pakistanensis]|uniref:TRAFs-binding domain-containing protein n=1 Tax=Microvirga pakistanensis TaxID=1682650 RepID=UPI00195CF060|nr:TRAFs-binding domain-containing protein [Microvirga pakistanensis]
MNETITKPTCFVVMGYGEKTDFHQNKTFNLDKSYQYIIKPAVTDAGFECVRADEIQHAGNINVPMYEQLLNADLVIADLSTANLNAFFELGVRYALKPRTTIVIAEKGFKIPFDMGQVVIRHYEHLGTGIDFGEVTRMRDALSQACREIFRTQNYDSPVYTFIRNLTPPALKAEAAALERESEKRTQDALVEATSQPEREALTKPLAELMNAALSARDREDFKTARTILSGVCAVQTCNADPFLIQQLALATYKSKDLDPKQRLLDAIQILAPLEPETSSDPETLGLWGAVHKRLAEIDAVPADERRQALDKAIWAYEKGFYLKNDHYNGINYAFLLDVRAGTSGSEEAVADRVLARRVRQRVLAIGESLLKNGIQAENEQKRGEQEYWVRATIVEALFGLGRQTEGQAKFNEAKRMKPAPRTWMIESTEEQLKKLGALILAQSGQAF